MAGCKLICGKCGNDSFIFAWTWKDDKELARLTMCHDGFGLMYEDANIECSKCHEKYIENKMKDIEVEEITTFIN